MAEKKGIAASISPISSSPEKKIIHPHPQPETETETKTKKETKVSQLNHVLSSTSKDRDVTLAKLNQVKIFSHIKAWEDNEKSKSLNKCNKEIAKINAWENSEKSRAETKLKLREEGLEKKRATYIEQMKNTMAEVHQSAEEKRAGARAKKGEEIVKAEESAAKYKVHGKAPRKPLFMCF